MKRIVEPELLDELPPNDARAIHSRGDLRRLNWFMRHAAILRATLAAKLERPPQTIVEIGAGDGTLMLKLAARMHTRWPDVRVVMLDRQKIVSDDTLAGFQQFGWPAQVVTADVFEWLASASRADVVLANLFLHHFMDEKLKELFCSLAGRAGLFVACETRRDGFSSAACRFLGLIGCNSVSRHDALVSVRAGFANDELSALWPQGGDWELNECRSFAFTHLFVARRCEKRTAHDYK